MNRDELAKFFHEKQEAGDPYRMIYYCRAAKCTFFVADVDKDGKARVKTHPVTGAVETSKGRPVVLEIKEEYTPVVAGRTSKADALCCKVVESGEHGQMTPYKKEMVATLEEMCDRSPEEFMREAEYKQKQNPEAFAREQEMKALRREHEAKVQLAYDKGAAEAEQRLEGQIKDLRAQLKEAEELVNSGGTSGSGVGAKKK